MSELRLGDCRVRTDTGEILRENGTSHLEPKSMAVLVYLAERRGEVVGREELLEAVWPGIHVGDDSLTAAIIKIRRALGDDARNPVHIETIPKRGYRLISPVVADAPSDADTPVPASSPRRPFLAYRFLPALAAVLAILAAFLYIGANPDDPQPRPPAQANAPTVLSVVPFSNISGNPDQEYLALGISDSILNDLAHHSEFSVRQRLENVSPSTPADYVLQGSVSRTGGEIRIVARLLSGEDGAILKALQFERPFEDLLTIEDEIRDTVFTEITGSISAAERSRRARGYTDNMTAYDLFLQAQRKLLVRTAVTNFAAQALYQKAIAADENFARAYGGLALSYAADYRNSWAEDGDEALEHAMTFARTAIGISPGLPEQHWVIGYVLAQRRQFVEAKSHLRHAIDLAPGFADAYALLGGIETYRGNPESTIPLLRDALRINPDGGYLYFLLLARAYYFLGDFELAQINLSEALARNPESLEAHLYMAAALLHLDRPDEAEWEVMEVLGIEPDFSLNTWRQTYPMTRGEQLDQLLADLRSAGFS